MRVHRSVSLVASSSASEGEVRHGLMEEGCVYVRRLTCTVHLGGGRTWSPPSPVDRGTSMADNSAAITAANTIPET